MTAHLHSEITPGCYRCDLNRDEIVWAEQEEREQRAREAACPGHRWRIFTSRWDQWATCLSCGAEEER